MLSSRRGCAVHSIAYPHAAVHPPSGPCCCIPNNFCSSNRALPMQGMLPLPSTYLPWCSCCPHALCFLLHGPEVLGFRERDSSTEICLNFTRFLHCAKMKTGYHALHDNFNRLKKSYMVCTDLVFELHSRSPPAKTWMHSLCDVTRTNFDHISYTIVNFH
jgi:hypothetical protein